MYLKIHPQTPQARLIKQVADCLNQGGIIIYPTDSVYALACSLNQLGALERIERVKGFYTDSLRLSVVCADLSQMTAYCKPIDNSLFKLMKRHLPGPFTFILEANNKVPKIFKGKKKTVGIRVPDNRIVLDLVEALGQPLVSTSLPYFEEEPEYTNDPEFIRDRYENQVDFIIDGGMGGLTPSAIVDCTGPEPELIRQGPLPLQW